MENFNKNWLIILLVAVVFGTLGFLLGRTTGYGGAHHMMRFHRDGGREFVFEKEIDDGETTVKIDTVMKDGKKVITKEVKKIRKK